ncbi:hypothetical protein HYALB_00012363 [Hymenoscyphus albidus]|uniref:Uncharacterized protein n=1 Tax=Hymenoscyphus albidus TaxID=595503 RepID=A0A9N9LWD0_9HELO|nr:hypothetical protein HYALB_00012363 [Hymenoscyphus albidus]
MEKQVCSKKKLDKGNENREISDGEPKDLKEKPRAQKKSNTPKEEPKEKPKTEEEIPDYARRITVARKLWPVTTEKGLKLKNNVEFFRMTKFMRSLI